MISLPVLSFAQTPIHTWFRLTGAYHFNPEWEADLELQHRRQATYQTHNPFRYQLLYSIRPWLYYGAGKYYRIELSPLAYYSLYGKVVQEKDLHQQPVREWRNSLGVSVKQTLSSHFSINGRTLGEWRHFDNNGKMFRLRQKAVISYKWQNGWRADLQDEIFANLSGNIRAEQNRLGVAIHKQFKKGCETEYGYLYISRLPQTAAARNSEHNIYINLSFGYGKK